MNYQKLINELVYIKKCCKTCEWNFGVCASGGGKYDYGEFIKDVNYVCSGYEISFHDFCKLSPKQQWNHLKYLY